MAPVGGVIHSQKQGILSLAKDVETEELLIGMDSCVYQSQHRGRLLREILKS